MNDRPAARLTVLVTGAAGFVGRHVVSALAARGHDVIALQRHNALPAAVRAKCADVIVGDVCEPGVQREAVRNVGAVCHLAAYIPDRFDDPAEAEPCYRINALATLGLAAAAVERGVARFVYGSGGNMYNVSDQPADERDPVFPIDTATYYFVSKLAAEAYLTHLCERTATDAITLRIGTPYGPGEPDRKVVPTLLRRAARAEALHVLHGGKPMYSLVFVRDVADCAVSAVEGGPPGIYNVAAGEHTSLLELAQAVAATYPDRKPPLQIDPASASSPSGFPAMSIDKARRTWDFAPLNLREGLRQYRLALDANGETG